MFFNSSSFDYFKRDEPVAYMEKRPKGRTKKTKTPQPPPPMQKAKEKIIKNKDGTITLQKQDKGGFNQTINIYTGRQRATGTKGKGQNTIVKPKVELFTPSGRPDFKKWELYQSSYYNQLIDNRLLKLKDKEEGRLETPQNQQEILDRATDNIRRDLDRLEDRQTRTLTQIQDDQRQQQAEYGQWQRELLRQGLHRGGTRTQNRRTSSGSEHVPIHFLSQREKEKLRKQVEEEEARIEELEDPEVEVSEAEVQKISAQGLEKILRNIQRGKYRRSQINAMQKNIGEEITAEDFESIEDSYGAYIGGLKEELERQISELIDDEYLTEDLESTPSISESEYLREGQRKLSREQKDELRGVPLKKRYWYSQNLRKQTLYDTQPHPDAYTYLGMPDTLSDVEVTAIKLGINPLDEEGQPKPLKKLGREIGKEGAKRQVAKYEQEVGEGTTPTEALRKSRQKRPQGIPTTQKELRKIGGDIAQSRTKQGVITAVQDFRKTQGGQYKTIAGEISKERRKLTTGASVLDKHFLNDESNLLGDAGKKELERLFREQEAMTPKAYRELLKLRKELKAVKRTERELKKEQAEPLRKRRSELDEGGSDTAPIDIIEESELRLEPETPQRQQPEPEEEPEASPPLPPKKLVKIKVAQPEEESPLIKAKRKLEEQTGALEEELGQTLERASPSPPESPKPKGKAPFYQEALEGTGGEEDV